MSFISRLMLQWAYYSRTFVLRLMEGFINDRLGQLKGLGVNPSVVHWKLCLEDRSRIYSN